jgi:predicted dehydrogenase
MVRTTYIIVLALIFFISCTEKQAKQTAQKKSVSLITLAPGHFHAALIQKTMYDEVDSLVRVYAEEGDDLKMHLARIETYNTRQENPTQWREEVYTNADFFEKMIADKRGNIVVLAGNNQKKTEYILKSLQNGFNVLADKPMVIDSQGFEQLKQAFEVAEKNKLMLYDIMTERYEISTILQRELSMLPEIFGTLEQGSPENPAITKESIHHFYKYVSGSVLTRPAWFMDVSQQGEGIVDVMTHLVDLVQWECFPDHALDYQKDIKVNTATRWTTNMSLSEFKTITKLDSIPSYLTKSVADTFLKIYCNGEINYQLKGIHAKTSVIWRYKAPEGSGDTHHSTMRGTKANLVIRQGAEEQYKPTLYIEPITQNADDENIIQEKIKMLSTRYEGLAVEKSKNGWQVIVSEKLKEGHEAHFARVTEKFLEYFKNGRLPDWEIPNMLAKYYTTIQGLEIALKSKKQ